jgi:hypothetical protein
VSQRSLQSRIVAAAEEALARQSFLTPVDVCLGLGWLQHCNVDDWQHGRVDDLEEFLPVHDNRLIDLHVHLHHWATAHGLQRTEGMYTSATRTRRQLRFLADGHPLEEAAWRCLADEDARLRRRERDRERRAAEDVELQASLTREIRHLFPGCPTERAEAIARHTGLRGSGRVGRSAAGRSLDERAVTLAVAASVRHEDTDYDMLLMSGVSRDDARDQTRPAVGRALGAWT